MSSTRNPGRVAGFLYLLLVVIAPFRLIYIPSALFVRGNATATANNIVAHETLFRLGIVSDLICGVVVIFLTLALYRLFKGVDQNLAVLMVITLAMLFLRLHDQETIAAEIFWGLWLLPLAVLIYRSGFLPRFLGVWLTINGFAYVILSFTGLLLPKYYAVAFNSSFPALLGEMAFMLWLVIKGAKPQSLDAPPLDRTVQHA